MNLIYETSVSRLVLTSDKQTLIEEVKAKYAMGRPCWKQRMAMSRRDDAGPTRIAFMLADTLLQVSLQLSDAAVEERQGE